MATNVSAPSDAGAAAFASFTAFNPAMPELRKNPYPIYHSLRAAGPIFQASPGIWLVTRFAIGDTVLVDKRFATIDLSRMGRGEGDADLPETESIKLAREGMGRTMLFMDPPDHNRVRGLVSKAFTPRMVESLRPRIQAIADDLLSRFESGRDVDLIKEYAYPLPVIVIAEMLGVPAQDRDLFRGWASNLIPLIDFGQDTAAIERAIASMGEAREYLTKLVDERRHNPKDDLISGLTLAAEKGDRLSTDEMFINIVTILVGGHETTANLIGNGMIALLENRGELEKLQRDPSLINRAVEECLRYDPSFQATARRAVEDVEIGGVKIAKGNHVVVIMGACNRDPERFSDPDRFDITRENIDHMAFGGGIHFCLGASLARLEAQIAIGSLVKRFPNIRLTGAPLEIRDMYNVRGRKAIPVRV
ncbi:MAG TPA: cytochrome P450 [Candidatus Binataceae bacterium]|nr:cytochrome P450 [Candidatus Binataceae bacterium]